MTSKKDRKYELILASLSPRRKELLGWLDIPFEIYSMNIEEITKYKTPHLVVQDLATQKGRAVFEDLKVKRNAGVDFFPFIVAADTIVSVGKDILGIPKNKAEAKRMLNKMSGKAHQVFTGVYTCFIDKDDLKFKESKFYCKTNVEFAHIDLDLLESYLNKKDPYDKAGAYGIQGCALSFIKSVEGSYSNVVGFPLYEFHQHLKKTLKMKNEMKGKWRNLFLQKY